MTGDFEHRLVAVLGFNLPGQESSNSEMRRSTLLLRDEGIRRLLHAVVDESVRAVRVDDQLLTERFPEMGVQLLERSAMNDRQRGTLGGVSETRQSLHCFLGYQWESAQFGNHQGDDVIRVRLGSDGAEVPVPSAVARFEGDQTLRDELLQELIGEKGIAGGLFVHQLRQRQRSFARTAKCVRKPLAEVPIFEWP